MSSTVRRPAVLLRRSPSLWLLIGLVLLSLLGRHLLGGHDSAGHHVVLNSAATASAAPSTAPSATRVAAGMGVDSARGAPAEPTRAVAPPTDASHGDGPVVIGCVLLLLVGLVTALSCRLRQRSLDDRTPVGWLALQGNLRGPPDPVARLALCVQRT